MSIVATKKDLQAEKVEEVEEKLVEIEKELETELLQETGKQIKHLFRGISIGMPTGEGDQPVWEVEQEVNWYLNNGYEIVHCRSLERGPGYFQMVYVLLKE